MKWGMFHLPDPFVLNIDGTDSLSDSSTQNISYVVYNTTPGVDGTNGIKFSGSNYILYGNNTEEKAKIALGIRNFEITMTVRLQDTGIAHILATAYEKSGGRQGLLLFYVSGNFYVILYGSETLDENYSGTTGQDYTFIIRREGVNISINGVLKKTTGSVIEYGDYPLRLGGFGGSTTITSANNDQQYDGYIKQFKLEILD